MLIRVNALVLPAIVVATAGDVEGGATARWTGGGVYGADDVVLENEHLTVTIRPHRGGRVVSFADKRSRCDLACWRQDEFERRLDGGLFLWRAAVLRAGQRLRDRGLSCFRPRE